MGQWADPPQNREQQVLFATTLDSIIPDEHPVRLFDEILRSCDWSEWEVHYNGRHGRPAIHPRVMASAVLYGLSVKIRSSRVLEYTASHNVDFLWLLEGQSIDHSTICEFRTKFRDALKDLFRQIGRYALAMGVARLNEVALDGTRVKASNGRFETLTAEGIEARLKVLDDQLAQMFNEAEEADRQEQELFSTGESPTKLPSQLANAQARQEALKKALKKVQAMDKARRSEGIDTKKNPAQVPINDPDSRVLPNKEGGYAPNYTPIATTDVHGGFILDPDVIASTSEHTTTLASMDRIADNFGEYPDKALADGAHATGKNMEGMEERDIEFFSHIPSPDTDGSNPALREAPTEPIEESQKDQLPRSPQTKKFDKSAFVYDEEKNEYYCPQGKPLPYAEKKSKLDADGHRTYFDVYRSKDCEECPWTKECRSEKAKRGRTVSRDEHTKRREEFAEKMSQPESKKTYSKRFHAAETPFGILKQAMNLRQFLHRGLEKVQMEWLWACSAFNLAKLMREIARLRADLATLIIEGEG